MKVRHLRIPIFIFIVLSFSGAFAQKSDIDSIVVSPLIGDNMIIQRDKPIKIWGTSAQNAKVLVEFLDQAKMTKADNQGNWEITLKKQPAGGPYTLKVDYKEYNNVYIGDIWLAGGQSNMEWKLLNSNGFQEELNQDTLPHIHFFRTPKYLHNQEQTKLPSGSWKQLSKESLGEISAVAYFFAKEVQRKTGVPIAIVDHSWGGSDIQGWMSHTSFDDYPQEKELADNFIKMKIDLEQEEEKMRNWYNSIDTYDDGLKEDWLTHIAAWEKHISSTLPGKWDDVLYPDLDGVVWYRRTFSMGNTLHSTCTLNLGQIDDSDQTWINGVLVGSMYNAYDKNREYRFSSDILKDENEIIVRVIDTGYGGGFSSGPEHLYVECGKKEVNIAGEWEMKIGTSNLPPKPQSLTLNGLPSNRYNSMMIPLFNLPMTGMIWYQGESNVGQADKYAIFFQRMVQDYRAQWKEDFPFLFVQLANYHDQVERPESSSWAELREAQEKLLSEKNTAMATAIDIGDATDIHPRNKKDVGVRLAKGALHLHYGFVDIAYKNPSYTSHIATSEQLTISFQDYGQGMKSITKEIRGFHVELEDGTLEKVNAQLINDQIIIDIRNKKVKMVFYAWADNPGPLSLFGNTDLPLLPFRFEIIK